MRFSLGKPFSFDTLLRDARAYVRRRGLSLALVAVGAGLLIYVGSQYWSMYHSQSELEQEWKKQAAAGSASTSRSAADQLTRVVIPKIKLDAIVVEGASRKQLLAGPGHLRETALPGRPGNSVITAHRDTFFRHIFELNKGDEIMVQRGGETFRYQVTGKKIVKPEDVSVLKPSEDARLTLITCYPTYYIGPAPERLVVFSKLEP
jgi:sortase A